MSIIEPRLLKGFRDFSPQEELARQTAFKKIESVFQKFSFQPLYTPALEYKDILMGKYGDDEKLVYSFKDHGDRDVAMRYDLTVPLARFVAQNLGKIILPFKRYQIAPVWRADNTQRGRYREFFQCDVDTVGSDSELSDAEVIACLAKAIENVGVSKYRIRINDRSVFAGLSTDAIRILDKVEKIGLEGMVNEMRSRGVSEPEIIQASSLAKNDGSILPPERLQRVINLLDNYNLQGEVKFDTTIARGLDYYSSTVFETILLDKPEFGSICSGGRYDDLLTQFSKQSVAAVGGSIGIDRLVSAMEESGLLQIEPSTKILFANIDSNTNSVIVKLANDLRQAGLIVEIYDKPAKLDKQLKYAENTNFQFVAIIGSDEFSAQQVALKNLQTGVQEKIAQSEVVQFIENLFKKS